MMSQMEQEEFYGNISMFYSLNTTNNTNPHWAREMDKEGMCPSSGDINRMMIHLIIIDNNYQFSGLHRHHHHPHQPINVRTAGIQAFRITHKENGPLPTTRAQCGLTTANATGTNGLTCLPKHEGVRDNKFLVTHLMTNVA
jgi:hypothetical protein